MNIQVIDTDNSLWTKTLTQVPHDIYHLPEYVELEAKRIQSIPEAILLTEGEKIFFLPYLLRRCDDLFSNELSNTEVFDVVSPYGYPGFILNEVAAHTHDFLNLALQKLKYVFASKNICSVFLRLHPILNFHSQEVLPSYTYQTQGETVSIDLTLSESEIWHQTRPEHRNHINRCKRDGFIAKIVPFREYMDEFISIYNQTMQRVNAKDIYYFDNDYYQSLLNIQSKIHLCIVENNQQIACAGIFTECCDIVQYHLGGTNSDFLKQAPSKLMFDYVRFWAKKRGNKFLHLGGGVGSVNDSLYHFKAGFSKQRHPFLTLCLIIDEKKYLDLIARRSEYLKLEPSQLMQSNYFPAYRSR